MATQPPARAWEETPPAFMNNVMKTMLRVPGINRGLGSMIALISFTGRKSGKRYSTPVGYHRDGDTVTILVKRFRTWWRNFQTPAPVELLLAGRKYQGQAHALTDEATITPLLTRAINHARVAQAFGVRMNADGTPNADDIRQIAPKMAVIQVRLTNPQG